MAALSGGKGTSVQPSACGGITVPCVVAAVPLAVTRSPMVTWLRQGPAKEPGA